MDEKCETLLYIAYNLENQKQTVSIDVVGRHLAWMESREFAIEEETKWLVRNGFLARLGKDEFKLTGTGREESFKINKIRSKDDYDRMMGRSTSSAAYLDYCEEIYGYRMYLFNMMDKEQLDYLFNSVVIKQTDTVLDLGCGPGSILDYLAREYGCHSIGFDQLNQSIVEKCGSMISYINGDMDMLPSYNLKPDITLSVDSLYFSSNPEGLLGYLTSVRNNRLYIYYSQYIFDETKKDIAVLHCDNTRAARAMQKNGAGYKTVDYSENEYSLYERALAILPRYKDHFEREGNADLYEAKLRENKSGKELYEKGLASRYLYIVE